MGYRRARQYRNGIWYDQDGNMVQTPSPSMQHNIDSQYGMSLASDQFNRFVQSLQELSDNFISLDRESHNVIEGILCDLRSAKVIVTFGGHFKSGKSSIVNAALGRSILPVDDFPETGAICILRSGERDAAEVYSRRGRRCIDCNTAAIQQETSLISQAGERRTEVQEVERVEITLNPCTIPQHAWWIDSPGINDTSAMTERAQQASRLADVLVWVLSSKQLMSEPEVEFLASYVTERGPAAVVFMINAFLPEDAELAWQSFQAQRLPRHVNKIRDQATRMGFAKETMPDVIAVSARAVGTTGGRRFGNAFGGLELDSLLASLASPEHGRVQRARVYQAALELQKLATQIEASKVAKERQVLEERRAAAKRQRKQFEEDVKRAVAAFLEDWATRARTCGASVANTISTDSLLRDGTYSQQLTASLQAAAQEAYKVLQQEIYKQVRFYKQLSFSARHAKELGELLTPPAVEVMVPNTPVSGGTIATSTAAGVAVSVLPVIGWIVGAVGGAVYGVVKATREAMNKDVEGAKANVEKIAEQAVAMLRDRRQAVIAFIVRHCAVDDRNRPEAQPDDSSVRQWDSMLRSVQRLAEQALELAQRGN